MNDLELEIFGTNQSLNITAGYINDEPATWTGIGVAPASFDDVTFLQERESFTDDRGYQFFVHDYEFGTGIKTTTIEVKILSSEEEIKDLAPGDCFRLGSKLEHDRFVGVDPTGQPWIMKAFKYTEGIFRKMSEQLADVWKSFKASKPKLKIVPITFRAAKEFVSGLHRHHPAPQGHKFSIGVQDQTGQLRGVVMVGRPVSRVLDDGLTAEATRLCTDGAANACSMLYAAAWKAARAMGYEKLITYTLKEENGASLRASNFSPVAITKGRSWNGGSRKREDKHPTADKVRWQIGAACEAIAL